MGHAGERPLTTAGGKNIRGVGGLGGGGIPPEAEENFIILHLLPGDFLYSGHKSDTLEGVVQEYQYIPSKVKPANFHVNFLQHCYIHPCIFAPSLTPGHC